MKSTNVILATLVFLSATITANAEDIQPAAQPQPKSVQPKAQRPKKQPSALERVFHEAQENHAGDPTIRRALHNDLVRNRSK
jgi:hypothetical protein